RVVTEVFHEMLVDGDLARLPHEQCASVRRGTDDTACTDGAGGTRTILDHRVLAQLRPQSIGQNACHDVAGAARRITNHQAEWLTLLGLGEGRVTDAYEAGQSGEDAKRPGRFHLGRPPRIPF